jgi:hypothetical protein
MAPSVKKVNGKQAKKAGMLNGENSMKKCAAQEADRMLPPGQGIL